MLFGLATSNNVIIKNNRLVAGINKSIQKLIVVLETKTNFLRKHDKPRSV